MSITVFFAVIGAAALHACWNALVKSGPDKTASMAAIVIGHMPFALVILPFVPLPAVASYPYLVAGIALHFGYQVFLLRSYNAGDLTQVYPIARGSAPLLVALFSVMVLGVELNGFETLGILTIGCGLASFAIVRNSDGKHNQSATILALTTGLFIASYSLVDGIGARHAGTSLGFYSWLAIGNGALMMLFLGVTSRQSFATIITSGKRAFIFGGGASFIAYAIVTWAFTQAPIALVTALRETSIVFALLIGVFFLKERIDLLKLLSTFVTLAGAALLRYSKP